MRYAIISDIHSNRQALKAVLTDIQGIGADSIVCLGDIVGYGPSPEEVLETSYAKINHFVLGNHDAVICGKMSAALFNDKARKIIEWTGSVVGSKAAGFFRKFPLAIVGDNFRCAHGEFADPGRFGYIMDEKEAAESFAACTESMLFAGHSHNPCLFVIGRSGVPHLLDPQDFTMEDGKRYIVNAGSVGQPRDSDIRASYCIFDSSEKTVVFRKVPFDIDSYCDDLKKRKVPESTSYFLNIYRKQPLPPIRDILDFERVRPEDLVRTSADVKNLEKTVRNLRKTILVLLLVFVAAGTAAAAGIYGYVRQSEKTRQELSVQNIQKENEISRKTDELSRTESELVKKESELNKFRKTVFPPAAGTAALIKDFQPEQELISMPSSPGLVSEPSPAGIWTVTVSNPEKQKVFVSKTSDRKYGEISIFRIVSEEPELVEIASPPIEARPGMHFTGNCQMKMESFETGFIGAYVEQELDSGVRKILGQSVPEISKYGSKWTPRTSVTLGKTDPVTESGRLRFLIRGQFKGTILVRNCSMKEKDKL